MTRTTDKTTSLERAVLRDNPAFSLAQARAWIERAAAASDLQTSFDVQHMSTDAIRKLTSLRDRTGFSAADLITLLVEHGEWAVQDQIEKDKVTLLRRAESGASRPDEKSADPEERRLARALIAFIAPPGFIRDERRWRQKLTANVQQASQALQGSQNARNGGRS